MTRSRASHRVAIGSLLIAIGLGFFQNCGLVQGFGVRSVELPINHPSVAEEENVDSGPLVASKLVLGDKEYLESVFRDVFAPAGTPQGIVQFVDAVLNDEFVPAQNVLGQPCSVVEQASSAPCHGILLNMRTTTSPSTSTIREAARMQVCRRLVENDSVLSHFVARVRGSDPSPVATSAAAVVRSFYPNAPDALVSETAVELLNLDREMARNSERLIDRWRMLVLVPCESPDWQAL